MLTAGLSPNMPGQQLNPYGPGRGQTEGALSMSGLSEALPRNLPPQDDVERSAGDTSATLHQQSPSPFAGQTPMASSGYGMYSPQYATPYQQAAANAGVYPQHQVNQPSQNIGPGPIQPPYASHTYYTNQQQQPYLLYPGQYGQAGQPHSGLPASYAQPFVRAPNQTFGAGMMPGSIPDAAGIPARVTQYGGFALSGPLAYGYGSGPGFTRSDLTQGKIALGTAVKAPELM